MGETGGKIGDRLYSHRWNIRKGILGKGHVVAHFRRHGLKNLISRGIEHNEGWTIQARRKRERFWIRGLGTTYPKPSQ